MVRRTVFPQLLLSVALFCPLCADSNSRGSSWVRVPTVSHDSNGQLTNPFLGVERCVRDDAANSNSSEPALLRCLKASMVAKLKSIVASEEQTTRLLGGWLQLERVAWNGPLAPPQARGTSSQIVSLFETLSRQFAISMPIGPHLSLRLSRDTDGRSLKMSVAGVGSDLDDPEGQGHGREKKKKKKKKKLKLKKEDLKKLALMLMIPVVVQAIFLPIFLASLKLMAAKALVAGLLAVALVIFNAIRNASAARGKQDDAGVYEQFYGYNGGEEYGAYINKRSSQVAFRAHRPRSS